VGDGLANERVRGRHSGAILGCAMGQVNEPECADRVELHPWGCFQKRRG
jgi:hypothetical protein